MRRHALSWIALVLAAGCTDKEAPVREPPSSVEDNSGGSSGAACEIPRAETFAWSYRAGRYPLRGDEPEGSAGAAAEANGGEGGADGAGASGRGGASAAGEAGQMGVAVCSGETSFLLGHMDQYVDCAAMARVEASDAGVQLVFDDATMLETMDPLASTLLDQYEVVWVSYHLEEFLDGRTGSIVDEIRLEIREAPAGRLLVDGYGGAIPQATPANVESEIFGAPLQADPQCSLDLSTDCFGEVRTTLDFIVRSLPELRLPYGELTTVEHDDDRFAVRISNSVVVVTGGRSVCQSRPPTDTTAFMATRLNGI